MFSAIRISAALILVSAFAVPGGIRGGDPAPPVGAVILAGASETTVTSWSGASGAAAEDSRPLADLDTVSTGPSGRAAVVSPAGWTAELEAATTATIRTEAFPGRAAPLFRRGLDLREGSLLWSVKGGSQAWLRTPAGVLLAETARVRVSYGAGKMIVDARDGTVELTANTAYLMLKGGQRIQITFTASSNRFHVELLEDNGQAVDIEIGKTVIHATRGDIFDVSVLGQHLDVRVVSGIVQVTGPDKRTAEVGPGQTETVVGGAVGAATGPPTPRRTEGPPLRKPPSEPHPEPLRDLFEGTDISPS